MFSDFMLPSSCSPHLPPCKNGYFVLINYWLLINKTSTGVSLILNDLTNKFPSIWYQIWLCSTYMKNCTSFLTVMYVAQVLQLHLFGGPIQNAWPYSKQIWILSLLKFCPGEPGQPFSKMAAICYCNYWEFVIISTKLVTCINWYILSKSRCWFFYYFVQGSHDSQFKTAQFSIDIEDAFLCTHLSHKVYLFLQNTGLGSKMYCLWHLICPQQSM